MPLSATSSIHIRLVLQQIIVTPASASLVPGATQQFEAYGRAATGDSMPVNVTYTATGGNITPQGLFSAGSEAGRYQVTWDGVTDRGARAAAGIYFVRLEAGTQKMARKFFLAQ